MKDIPAPKLLGLSHTAKPEVQIEGAKAVIMPLVRSLRLCSSNCGVSGRPVVACEYFA